MSEIFDFLDTETGEINFYSPLVKGYMRGICRELKNTELHHSSVYGTALVYDSMTRKGARIYIMALNDKFRLIDTKMAHISFLYDTEKLVCEIEEWVEYTGAYYIIVCKAGCVANYMEELHIADALFKKIKTAKLYDYLTIEGDRFRSYMEKLT